MVLLAAVGHSGLYGLLMRAAGPQVRGGESVSILRVGARPVDCIGDHVDRLAALDWRNIERFADELPLAADARILCDPAHDPIPLVLSADPLRQQRIAFGALAAQRSGGRANLVAVGALGAQAGLTLDALIAGARDTLAAKGDDLLATAEACIDFGYRALLQDAQPDPPLLGKVAPADRPRRWRLSGNVAAGLGALRAGVGFVAAYPITPASEMLEWLAPRIARCGGDLIQAEDELAAVNMLVGASFGGVPALTATSGPGLSLMIEGIGLAVASETPIVVVDVARGGPSTGLPAKSEQADLDQALYGLHGDAPHLVLAPTSIADAARTVEWASRLAEHLQTAAIVLSDQSLGQSQVITDLPPHSATVPRRRRAASPAADGRDRPSDTGFERYGPSHDRVSAMPIPGEPGLAYTAEGLEHDRRGVPSSRARDHAEQLAKRRDKLLAFEFGPTWVEIDRALGADPAQLSLLTWGSSWGAVREATETLRRAGLQVQALAPRLLAPLQRSRLRAILGDSQVLVVEINQSAQLFRYLHAERALPPGARSFSRPGPLPLRPAEIVAELKRGLGG